MTIGNNLFDYPLSFLLVINKEDIPMKEPCQYMELNKNKNDELNYIYKIPSFDFDIKIKKNKVQVKEILYTNNIEQPPYYDREYVKYSTLYELKENILHISLQKTIEKDFFHKGDSGRNLNSSQDYFLKLNFDFSSYSLDTNLPEEVRTQIQEEIEKYENKKTLIKKKKKD